MANQTLKDRLDALLDEDLSPETVAAEIERTQARLRLLEAIRNGDALKVVKLVKPAKKVERPRIGDAQPAADRKRLGRPPMNGKPAATSSPADPLVDLAIADLPTRVATYLKAAGPKRRDAIGRACQITEADLLEQILKGDWFEKDGTMWTLSSEGHAHFRRNDD